MLLFIFKTVGYITLFCFEVFNTSFLLVIKLDGFFVFSVFVEIVNFCVIQHFSENFSKEKSCFKKLKKGKTQIKLGYFP